MLREDNESLTTRMESFAQQVNDELLQKAKLVVCCTISTSNIRDIVVCCTISTSNIRDMVECEMYDMLHECTSISVHTVKTHLARNIY